MNSGIRILGVRGHAKTEQLQATAQCALKELNMNIPLVQYTEIEDFIRFKLSAIPAIILNGKIIFQKEIPEKEDLKIILKLLTMKNIIVPIDFSETSKNALHFAKDMTADLYPENTQIKVANVYNALFNTDNPLIIRGHKPVGEAVLKAIQSFMDLDGDIEKEENKVKEDLKVSAYPLFGTPVNKLEELSKDPKTKLIVMGTHGKNKINIERRIFGSIASEVSLKAHSPVLLIPAEVSYKRFKNIMIASDNLVPAEEHLHVLKTLIANEEASYHLVHVNKYEKEEAITAEKSIKTVITKAGIPENKSTIRVIDLPDIPFGLNSYAEMNDIDLLVVTTKHRNFWKEMLHSSSTQALILEASLAILVLHTEY
jgi:nucleotide-binding universal stress UspA family protein